jgi:hypothetical protein
MIPDMNNDPHVLVWIALASLAVFAYQTWRKRNDHH